MSKRHATIVATILCVTAFFLLVVRPARQIGGNRATDKSHVVVKIGETEFKNFSSKVLPDGTIQATAQTGDQELTEYYTVAAGLISQRYELRRDGKLTRIGEIDENGKEVYMGLYHMKGYLWVVTDRRDATKEIHECLNPDGTPANRYITLPDGTREGNFYDEGKLTQKRYKADGVTRMDFISKDGKLQRRRAFDRPNGFTDTFFNKDGNARFRQLWTVADGWQRSASLEEVEVFDAEGKATQRVVTAGGAKLPREVHTRADENWRVVYYRADGTPLTAELRDQSGKLVQEAVPGKDKPVQEAVPNELLTNQDDSNLVPGPVI